MTIEPIAYFRSPFTSKFGIPRQSGIASEVEGEIVFQKPYNNPEAIRGIEGFSHLWIIWEFSANRRHKEGEGSEEVKEKASLTVRPPRLGGNERVGVFASRSPFRPNSLGLSCVKLKDVRKGVLVVLGADLLDGTPIYDVKPYVSYADSHPEAICGYTDNTEWNTLDVVFPDSLTSLFSEADVKSIISALQQDPRPRYHDNPERIYAMPFRNNDIFFCIKNGKVIVTEVKRLE